MRQMKLVLRVLIVVGLLTIGSTLWWYGLPARGAGTPAQSMPPSTAAHGQDARATQWDIFADTWVATDALGRSLPTFGPASSLAFPAASAIWCSKPAGTLALLADPSSPKAYQMFISVRIFATVAAPPAARWAQRNPWKPVIHLPSSPRPGERNLGVRRLDAAFPVAFGRRWSFDSEQNGRGIIRETPHIESVVCSARFRSGRRPGKVSLISSVPVSPFPGRSSPIQNIRDGAAHSTPFAGVGTAAGKYAAVRPASSYHHNRRWT